MILEIILSKKFRMFDLDRDVPIVRRAFGIGLKPEEVEQKKQLETQGAERLKRGLMTAGALTIVFTAATAVTIGAKVLPALAGAAGAFYFMR